MNITVLGASSTKFGELWKESPRSLARRAFCDALGDSGVTERDIEALFVGNMLSGMLGSQEHLGAFFADELGISGASVKVEGACASGGLAVHSGVLALLSGLYKTVAILGVEKMTDHRPEDVASALIGAGSEEERISGITFPGLYAMLARAYMEEFLLTSEQLASVSVKNHFHGSKNPKAQFHCQLTIEQVMRSSMVSDPLRLLDCSPISDGASCVILTTKKVNKGVEIIASSVATDSLALTGRKSLTELEATIKASEKAFKQASLAPHQIQVAELHDCFSIAEIFAMENIGFVQKGTAGARIKNGDFTYGVGTDLITNTSGGLKACGHPVGATGVKQIVEIYDQLRGCAHDRQVENATYGLAHNVGGSGATAVIHILEGKHE